MAGWLYVVASALHFCIRQHLAASAAAAEIKRRKTEERERSAMPPVVRWLLAAGVIQECRREGKLQLLVRRKLSFN